MYKLLPKFETPNGLVESKMILRIADNAFIPMSEENSDYQAYLKFLADGGQPLPADEAK
jgi:hypothetical protein